MLLFCYKMVYYHTCVCKFLLLYWDIVAHINIHVIDLNLTISYEFIIYLYYLIYDHVRADLMFA